MRRFLQYLSACVQLVILVGIVSGILWACATISRVEADESKCLAPTLAALAACKTGDAPGCIAGVSSWAACVVAADQAGSLVHVHAMVTPSVSK